MDQNNDVKPFSYDILDEEAAKISKLILAVQQKCAQANGADVSAELFEWAEGFAEMGRRAEAEFLYLHAINVYERNYGIRYPIVFTSLREFARDLLTKTERTPAPNTVPLEAIACASIIETNAA